MSTLSQNVTGLCDDIVITILSFLSRNELLALQLVNKSFKLSTLSNHDALWRPIYTQSEIKFCEYFSNSQRSEWFSSHDSESNPNVKCEGNYKSKLLAVIRAMVQQRKWKISTLIHNPHHNPFVTLSELKQYEMVHDPLETYKVVAVGDAGIGKTCSLIMFSEGVFPFEYIPTLGGLYELSKAVGSQTYNLQLWDSAGQCDYDRLRPLCYPDTHVFLMQFSCSDEMSFFETYYKWIPEVRHHVVNPVIVMMLNKVDLRTNRLSFFCENLTFPIESEEGEAMARNLGCVTYLETSAMKNIGLDDWTEVIVKSYDMSLQSKTRKKCQLQ